MCINEWIDVWTLKKYHDKSRLCVRCVFCEYVGENNDDVWHVRVCVCVCVFSLCMLIRVGYLQTFSSQID